jgi:6-phosphogluconolactonase
MLVHVAPSTAAAATETATRIGRWVRSALRLHGSASLAISGGRTPEAMLTLLASVPFDWSHVDIWQVDERVAPDGHPDRNARLLDLFRDTGARMHPMPVTAKDLRAAAARYARGLPARFDVVHLGVGADGHTASWPPGHGVVDSPRLVEITDDFNGFARMTLTPRAVNAARHRVVEVNGADKAAPIRRWLEGDRSLPVQRVRRTGTVVVLDPSAAGRGRGR